MNIQVKVALDKAKHPERYCPERRCLWHTGGDWCPRHRPVEETLVPEYRISDIAEYGMDGARDAAGRRPARARFTAKLAKPLVGPLATHEAPWRHEPLLMKQPDDQEWQPLLVGVQGGRS